MFNGGKLNKRKSNFPSQKHYKYIHLLLPTVSHHKRKRKPANNLNKNAAPRGTREFTIEDKNKVAQWLLLRSKNGKLQHGAQREAEATFGISKRTVYKVWKQVEELLAAEKPVILDHKSYTQCKDKMKLDEGKVKSLSVLERSSIRKLAVHLNVSKSTVGRWIKAKQIKPHTSAIKPTLTDMNKIARLKWTLSHLNSIFSNEKVSFHSMHNIVHIDEKWFYLTKCTDRYYLLPDEEIPYRSCKSKRFITKVMFMCAVSRPRKDRDENQFFDGKFGIFPFTFEEPAKRSSKNKSKGTLETKPIYAITKSVIKECIINQIIPSIKTKWPPTVNKHIIIQHDNAKPHITNYDPDFRAAANVDGFTIELICQPLNSPDTNVNDLGFFRAIQSLQDDKHANGVEDLLRNVRSSYQELSLETLNNVFLTLQGYYTEIMKVKGGNNYKIPHINKARLIRSGTFPNSLDVDVGLVRECLEYLRMSENNDGSAYNIGPLVSAFGY